MNNKLTLIFLLCALNYVTQAKNRDSIQEPQKIFPAITIGTNYTGRWNSEIGFLLGITNSSDKETKMTSMLMHGPSLGCFLGTYNNAYRIAPKFSYEYYTPFLAGKISIADYMDNNIHAFYICPEAGLSFGTTLNLFFGANLPVSPNKITEIKTFRFTASVNILFFYFKKSKKN